MNHHIASSDFMFAMKPPVLSTASDEAESTDPSPSGRDTTNSSLPADSQSAAAAAAAATSNPMQRVPKIRALGKTLGGAFSKINVAKWIDELECDQELADHLDRINNDTADEQERQMIKRQAMEACLQTMKEHLLEFLAENPQATYEEWICNLHPDNINMQLEGLTNTPMIDHRFYVADSDHRLLWNEHLNDLEDTTNMNPVRHFVAARTFAKKPSIVEDANEAAGSSSGDENELIDLENNPKETKRDGVEDLLSL
jgi:hypothetical protein